MTKRRGQKVNDQIEGYANKWARDSTRDCYNPDQSARGDTPGINGFAEELDARLGGHIGPERQVLLRDPAVTCCDVVDQALVERPRIQLAFPVVDDGVVETMDLALPVGDPRGRPRGAAKTRVDKNMWPVTATNTFIFTYLEEVEPLEFQGEHGGDGGLPVVAAVSFVQFPLHGEIDAFCQLDRQPKEHAAFGKL